jgi:RNA 2',3'-cyclic 3'-phosphodiesterase
VKVRLFFALWPDPSTRAKIAAAAAAAAATLRLEDRAARRVPPENFHLTLAFLGEASMSELAALRAAAREWRGSSCTLRFDRCEYWPAPRVVAAVGAVPSPAPAPAVAVAVAQDSWAALSNFCRGLRRDPAAESVAPRPHVTLARKVMQAPVPQAMSPFDWHARSFSLVRSDPAAGGSVYTVVDTWPLLDKSPKS